MPPTVTFAARTDIGLTRKQNEDNLYTPGKEGEAPDGLELFAVADGMGGHRGGKMASQIAVDELVRSYRTALPEGTPEERIIRAVQDANHKIFETSAVMPEYFGMGTTLTSMVVVGDEAIFGHAGDSRAYHYRNGRLTQVTLDHSLVAQAVREGILTEEQARIHPQRNIITRALGTRTDLEVDTAHVRLEKGDILLLASDGLHGLVEDPELREIMATATATATATAREDLERLAEDLVQAALDRGGIDNVTVVLIRYDGE